MSATPSDPLAGAAGTGRSFEERVAAAPAVPAEAADGGLRARIRALRTDGGRRLVAIDDDPTGSQSVHGVQMVLTLEPSVALDAISEDGATAFVLTNSRSMDVDDAVSVDTAVAAGVLSGPHGASTDLISRSDSTLRGYVVEEVGALDAARRQVCGRGYDVAVLAPAMFEAGRATIDDLHWARVQGTWIPVGESEFAKDASFGYRSSDLKDFVAERSHGAVSAEDVRSLTLEDIRVGGAQRVAEVLGQCTAGEDGPTWVVANALEYADYETVALGILLAQRDHGRQVVVRCGPSFCRAWAGIEPQGPVTADQLWPGEGADARSAAGHGHGLVVVGSHVGQTARQLARARAAGGFVEIEIDVEQVTAGAQQAQAHIDQLGDRVVEALRGSDVMVYTTRTLKRTDDPAESLAIARAVSDAVVRVVQLARRGDPAWVIAKGGITSHTVAADGLGIRRGTVLGQLFPGMVSALRADDAPTDVIGTVYVVFPGNVGDDDALARAVALFRGEVDCAAT